MNYSIAWDIETTSLHTMGNLLNVAFFLLDEKFEIVDELCLNVQLPRLELPDPFSVAITNTDIIKHQSEENLTVGSLAVLNAICAWQDRCIGRFGKMPRWGYNSTRFDMKFLRTKQMSRGVNPYHYGKIFDKDLYHVVKRLVYRGELPNLKTGDSLTLENVCRALELTSHEHNLHDSREDTLLTIRLAKHLYTEFGVDVRTYSGYEPSSNQVAVWKYNREGTSERMILADQNKTQSLWFKVDTYLSGGFEEENDLFFYCSKKSGSFVIDESKSFDLEQDFEKVLEDRGILKEVNTLLESKTIANYFWNESDLDIEFDIYRLGFAQMDLLHECVFKSRFKDVRRELSDDAFLLYRRFVAETHPEVNRFRVNSLIKEYCKDRYTKRLYTSRHKNEDERLPTLKELYCGIEEIEETMPEKRHLMKSLREYYDDSIVSDLLK